MSRTSTSGAALPGAYTLLKTKTQIPKLRGAFVERPALFVRLDAGLPLTVVCAPPGSGKTMLLARWAARQRGAVAWLSLDAHIVGQARVFPYVHAALQAAGVTLPNALPAADSLGVATLLDTLDRAAQGLCIVIDGFESLQANGHTGHGLLRALEYLVLNSPAHVHWIVASRCAPGLCVSQLQLSDQCVVLGAREVWLPSVPVIGAGALLLTFLVQVSLQSKDGLVRRMQVSVTGVVVILAVASLAMLLTASGA